MIIINFFLFKSNTKHSSSILMHIYTYIKFERFKQAHKQNDNDKNLRHSLLLQFIQN